METLDGKGRAFQVEGTASAKARCTEGEAEARGGEVAAPGHTAGQQQAELKLSLSGSSTDTFHHHAAVFPQNYVT